MRLLRFNCSRQQISLHPELEGVLLLAGGFAMGRVGAADDATLQQQYRLDP